MPSHEEGPFYANPLPERPRRVEKKTSEPKPVQAARTILTIGRRELDGPPKSIARQMEGLEVDIRMAHVPPHGVFKEATPEQIQWLRLVAARVKDLEDQVAEASIRLNSAADEIVGLTKEDMERLDEEVEYSPDDEL